MDLRIAVAVVVAGLVFFWVFKNRAFRKSYGRIATGSTIGAIIAFGWVVTTYARRTSFDPVQVEAGSFVVPVADTVLQFVTFTGVLPDYGVGLVVGVVLGAAGCALHRRDLRWEACDSAGELGRHLVGGVLMGTGGVFAMGCTVGQGVTAFSALAVSAPLAIISIAVGARLGLAYLVEGSPLPLLSWAATRANAKRQAGTNR
jgi:hypothetical protein